MTCLHFLQKEKHRQCTYNVILWHVRVDLHVTLLNVKVFIVAMKMQQWTPLALLSSYKIFRFAVNNINVLTSSYKVPDFLSDCNQVWSFSRHIFVKISNFRFHENPSSGSRADTYGQTDMKLIGAFAT
jgi:hypothetical protein